MNDSDDTHHYFDSSPKVRDSRSLFHLDSPLGTLAVETSAGVFSSRGLDKGTAVLLDAERKHAASAPPEGAHLCDLGTGSGALALVLAATYPMCTVHAVDVNERARRLCTENAARNGLHNVVTSSPDDIDPDLTFHVLWSNPPIRIGKPALHDLLTHWLERLHPDGRADLVVARNLGADSLSTWMEGRGFDVSRLASSKGFRVLRVRRR